VSAGSSIPIPGRLREALRADTGSAPAHAAASQNASRRTSVHDPAVAHLVQFVRTLPTDTRRVFTLRKVYGVPYADIAARLTMSVAEVERHLTKAAIAYERSLEPRGRP
jgi:DNA-directed RNA polymerase specialized sigma24 family protein